MDKLMRQRHLAAPRWQPSKPGAPGEEAGCSSGRSSPDQLSRERAERRPAGKASPLPGWLHARVFLIKLWLPLSEGEGSLQALDVAGHSWVCKSLLAHMCAIRVKSVDLRDLSVALSWICG